MKQLKEIAVRKWHRHVGISIMPLLVMQVMSGFVLSVVDSFGLIERTPQAGTEGIAFLVLRKVPKFFTFYDELMMTLHFTGGQFLGTILRTLTAVALIWVMFSGAYLFLNIRARERKMKQPAAEKEAVKK